MNGVELIDVPSLTTFGTLCSRSLQCEGVVVLGASNARTSRVVMGGLNGGGGTASNAEVMAVLESRASSMVNPADQKSAFALKMNRGSDGLDVAHETLVVESTGSLTLNDASNEAILTVDAATRRLTCASSMFESVMVGEGDTMWRLRTEEGVLVIESRASVVTDTWLRCVEIDSSEMPMAQRLQEAEQEIVDLKAAVLQLQQQMQSLLV